MQITDSDQNGEVTSVQAEDYGTNGTCIFRFRPVRKTPQSSLRSRPSTCRVALFVKLFR